MKTRSFRLFILTALFLSQILIKPGVVLAEISEFTPTNHQPAALVLGQPDFTSSAPASNQIGMRSPIGVAVDPTSGKVFVADQLNHRVLRFASLTALSNGLAAEAVLGQADFISNLFNRGGPTAPNSMASPMGVTVDSEGRLWVADVLNNRLLRFDNATAKANGADADGVLGQSNFNSSSAATTQSGMNQPLTVFVDAGGRLWVAEITNNRVLRFDAAATKANGANADGVLGQADFTSNGAATTQSGMNHPSGLFVDSSGRLWVSGFSDNRVLRFDDAAAKDNGDNADGVLGQADFTSSGSACAQNRMSGPRGVSGDLEGRLYVPDIFNSRVLIFEEAAGLANGADADNVLGQSVFNSCAANAGGLSAASLNAPSKAFYDPAARVLWVVDTGNQRVLMYGNPAELATLVLGQPDFTSNTPTTTQTGIGTPYGVAVDPNTGKVFVAEQFNNRVLRFASATALNNGAAAEAVLGQADFTSGLVNRGGSVAANTMDTPFGVFVDTSERLWVADVNNNRVLRFDNATAKANGADADGVLGQPDFTSQAFATTQSGMSSPYHAFIAQDGELWVADYLNNRVLRFEDAATKANGADADGVLGQPDFVSNTAASTQNGMRGPAGLYVDLEGRLWVADRSNDRVLRFDNAASKADGANASGVLGQVDFTSNEGACAQNRMFLPRGVSGDFSGRLYVADGNNNRVLIFEEAAGLPNGSNASSLLGQPNFVLCTPNTGGVSAAALNTPTRIFFDTTANVLWVADWQNNRLLMYGTPEFRMFLPVIKN